MKLLMLGIATAAMMACSDSTPAQPDAADPDANEDCAAPCKNGGQCVDRSCECVLGFSGGDCGIECDIDWSPASAEPLAPFSFGAGIDLQVWNDPIVRKEGGTYRMWLSGGNPTVSPIVVEVYHATSNDGLDWDLTLTPIISPGTPEAWDDNKIETPTVIVDGEGTYHLYYSGMSVVEQGVYDIGHATSPDGLTWTKDPANPVIARVGGDEVSDWGVFTVAEPAAVYNPDDETISVYYTSFGTANAQHRGNTAIMLATSTDGSTFVEHRDKDGNREPVWSLTTTYSGQEYRGYSTPAIVIGPDGLFHLTYDVVFTVDGFEQVAFDYARSRDGVNFTEFATDLVHRGPESWIEDNVNGQFLLHEEEHFSLWFAGQGLLIDTFDTFESGIGHVVGVPNCPE